MSNPSWSDDSLEERAAEAASKAVCTRCQAPMSQPLPLRSEGRLTTGTYRQVGQKGTRHFNLCADCAPAFLLFLTGSVVLA